ncbi:DapH/DapD/GlmU-related protein [Marinobacter salarius]|uniref:DapH/DapD/GlmU-related protein n=1 Tax=Marinobacter salarius TaxID=1420917 RepID=UPI003D9C5FA6
MNNSSNYTTYALRNYPDGTLVGANSYIAPGVKICDNVLIGTNSVVVTSISEPGVYSGNPARRVK